jgi:hypothetical protein
VLAQIVAMLREHKRCPKALRVCVPCVHHCPCAGKSPVMTSLACSVREIVLRPVNGAENVSFPGTPYHGSARQEPSDDHHYPRKRGSGTSRL